MKKYAKIFWYEKAQGGKAWSAVDRSETEIRSISQHLIVSRMHLGAVFAFPILIFMWLYA